MSLELKINGDIKNAMLARDAKKLEALRAIKAALLLEKAKEGAAAEIGEEVELKILQKMVKQRRESADIYSQAGRPELAEKELYDASVIETYLPQQMSEAEVTAIIQNIVTQTGASSVKDMGKVMGAASKELTGKADNKMISVIVKNLLANS
jgi:uncharacterized protein YqeY